MERRKGLRTALSWCGNSADLLQHAMGIGEGEQSNLNFSREPKFQSVTLRDQASLPSGWPLEREAPSFAHRLHRLLNGEQLGRMRCFEVPWASCCQRDCTSSRVIRGFIDCDSIILPKAEVEADQPSTTLLYQFSTRHTAVLRVLRHRCQSFRGVRELGHVKRHNVCLLCGYCFFARRKCDVKAEIQRSIETRRDVQKSGYLSASISAKQYRCNRR